MLLSGRVLDIFIVPLTNRADETNALCCFVLGRWAAEQLGLNTFHSGRIYMKFFSLFSVASLARAKFPSRSRSPLLDLPAGFALARLMLFLELN